MFEAGDPGRRDDTDGFYTRIYEELRRLARRELRAHPPAASLNTTALVHEAWLKMRDTGELTRPRYLALAAVAMRHVFANHIRDKKAAKRGRDWQRVTLSEVGTDRPEDAVSIEAVTAALDELRDLNDRHARLAEMRLFAGMTVPDCAEVLEVSVSTVEREWRVARAWIGAHLERAS